MDHWSTDLSLKISSPVEDVSLYGITSFPRYGGLYLYEILHKPKETFNSASIAAFADPVLSHTSFSWRDFGNLTSLLEHLQNAPRDYTNPRGCAMQIL